MDKFTNARSIVVDPTDGNNIWVARNSGEDGKLGFPGGNVYKSTDGGNSWSLSGTGLPDGRPVIVIDPNSPSSSRSLFALSYGNGVFKSTDGGNVWSAINNGMGTDGENVWDIALNIEEPKTAYVALNSLDGSNGGIYKTTDGGNIWNRLSNFPDGDVLSIELDIEEPQTVYASVTNSYNISLTGGLYKSTDGGNSWAKVLDQPRITNIEIQPGAGNNKTVLVSSQPWNIHVPGQNSGVYKTKDGGNTWEVINGDIGHVYVQSIRFNPHNPDQVWVGTHGGGLFTSGNAIATGFEDPIDENDKRVRIYPNPFTNYTRIVLDDMNNANVTFKLFDQLGRQVRIEQSNNNAIQIEKGNLGKGVYYYSITSKDGLISSGKLVIQ